MKARRVVPLKFRVPKKIKRSVYKNLEIAMERRAFEIHRKAQQESKPTEIGDWTGAEADMLEG